MSMREILQAAIRSLWCCLSHGYWHDCRGNCFLFDGAKRVCAEQRGLTNGAVVTWKDGQPFFTNSYRWGMGRCLTNANEIPKCPAGGTYALHAVGYWSLCSVPYHQWANCKRKKPGPGAWREYDEPNAPTE